MVKTLSEIQVQSRNLKRKMLRCRESHDLKGLLRLKPRIAKLADEVEAIQARVPVFRRSYSFETFLEELVTGRVKKNQVP